MFHKKRGTALRRGAGAVAAQSVEGGWRDAQLAVSPSCLFHLHLPRQPSRQQLGLRHLDAAMRGHSSTIGAYTYNNNANAELQRQRAAGAGCAGVGWPLGVTPVRNPSGRTLPSVGQGLRWLFLRH